MAETNTKNEKMSEVISFVSDTLGIKADKIKSISRIQSDLGCTGDDAIELMEAFGKKFEISLEKFEFNRHFDSEGFNPFGLIFDLIFRRNELKKQDLTIDDLVTAVQNGKWITPPPP